MSCWVAPAIAAEYLGISPEELEHRLRTGIVPSRQEHGFLFVDVAPGSPMMIRPADAPPTFVAISPDELAALSDEETPEPLPITSGLDWTAARRDASQRRHRPAA